MFQAYEFIGMFMAIPVISSILLTLRICWKLGRKIILLATYNLKRELSPYEPIVLT